MVCQAASRQGLFLRIFYPGLFPRISGLDLFQMAPRPMVFQQGLFPSISRLGFSQMVLHPGLPPAALNRGLCPEVCHQVL